MKGTNYELSTYKLRFIAVRLFHTKRL